MMDNSLFVRSRLCWTHFRNATEMVFSLWCAKWNCEIIARTANALCGPNVPVHLFSISGVVAAVAAKSNSPSPLHSMYPTHYSLPATRYPCPHLNPCHLEMFCDASHRHSARYWKRCFLIPQFVFHPINITNLSEQNNWDTVALRLPNNRISDWIFLWCHLVL